MRERKELACGDSMQACIENLQEQLGRVPEPEKYDFEHDATTGLWSAYHKRKPTDKTIKRPISRVSRAPYANGYGRDLRQIVVTLHPRELIQTRLKGTRRTHQISWDDLHAHLVRRDALAAMNAKRREREAKRKARKLERKGKR